MRSSSHTRDENHNHQQHYHHLSLNHEDRWGTTDDFATSLLHFSLFSAALCDLTNSRPVHSLMLSSHFFLCMPCFLPPFNPQWGAADAEIKVPSGKNIEHKRFPFKAWSRSVYSHTCYYYCQEFLSCLFLPFRSIRLHFSKTSPDFSCDGCG